VTLELAAGPEGNAYCQSGSPTARL
jgi:hypothetical protein